MGIEYPLCRYRVDPDDRIDWVDGYWLAFARENGASELTENAILGRKLWDFIVGEFTQQVYLKIHDCVRSSGHSAVVPFRCDSPSMRRHMRLTVTNEPSGGLMYESLLLRAESQRCVGVLDPRRDRSNEVLEMCSFCKRALVRQTGWQELQDAYVSLRLFESKNVPELRYVVCSRCERNLEDESTLVGASSD